MDMPDDTLSRGRTLLEAGRSMQAYYAAEDCLGKQPGHGGATLLRAQALDRMGRSDEALIGYREALDRGCEPSRANLGIAGILRGRGQTAEATLIAASAHDAAPGDRDILMLLAALQLEQGRPDLVLALHRSWLANHPREADSVLTLGELLGAAGQADEAIATYRAFHELEPGHWEITNRLSIALLKRGETETALAVFRRCAAAQTADARPVYNLAGVLNDLGRKEEALAAYEAALRIDPDHLPSLSNLSYLSKELGLVERYQPHRERILRSESAAIPLAPTDTPEAIEAIEVDPRGCDAKTAAAKLSRLGCILVKGAIGTGLYPLIRQRFDASLTIAQYGSCRLADLLPAGLDTAEALVVPFLRAVLREALGRDARIVGKNCYARCVTPGLPGSSVPFHQDATAFNQIGVNVWLPIVACGRERPGLQLVGRRITQAIETSAGYDHNEIPEEVVTTRFGTALIAPEMAPGDALLFLSSTIHRSHIVDGMIGARESLEIRFD